MRRIISTGVIAAALLLSAAAPGYSGANQDAVITLDMDATTHDTEVSCAGAVGERVLVGVRISDAEDLTGYMVRISFNADVVEFTEAQAVVPGSMATAFLAGNGGELGPMLAKVMGEGLLDVVHGMKLADGASVAGSGLLACVVFTRKKDGPCSITIEKAQLSDSELAVNEVALQ